MKALRWTNNTLAVTDIARPASFGEALIRVTRAGICRTDVEIVRGYAGFQGTLGHEFVGVVEEAEAHSALVGRRVVGEINVGCGQCGRCLTGDARHCATRTVLGIHGRDGAHAEFLRLPVENLLFVPDNVTDDQAVFTEPLAAACGILERVPSFDGIKKAAVIGDGKLGLLCAQVLLLQGVAVTLIGKHTEKMRIAGRRGAELVKAEQAAELPRNFPLVIESSGHPQGFETALQLLEPCGTLVLKSTFHGATPFDERIVVNEITIVGSRCGRFAPALALLEQGAVDVESLISEIYPLTDGVHALNRAATGGVLKVLMMNDE